MIDDKDGVFVSAVNSNEQGMALMEKLMAVAQPDTIYSEPIVSGDHTVITASEVSVVMGFAFGASGGSSPVSGQANTASEDSSQRAKGRGFGAGAAGGRPVAAIIIGPRGVYVDTVVDPTKIVLAFFIMLGSIFMMGRMRRITRKL
jgi:uncharacterized spore protein YtfJ